MTTKLAKILEWIIENEELVAIATHFFGMP